MLYLPEKTYESLSTVTIQSLLFQIQTWLNVQNKNSFTLNER